jgi:hypothetical protein
MLSICTWLWGNKYNTEDVRKLRDGLKRHLRQQYRFLLFSDCPVVLEGVHNQPILDMDLLDRGCFCRLRRSDPEWQKANHLDERIVNIDLDVVITGPLDPLFDRPEPFVILHGANAANPCPYNGSLSMLRAGYRPDVWSDFSVEAAKGVPFYSFPDDQGWLHHKLPNAAAWNAGSQSGVYAFKKPGWPQGNALPADARMVVFPGWRSPAQFKHLPWIKEHWK